MPGEVRTAILEAARPLSGHVREIVLRPDEPDALTYLPGQWISLRLPVGERPPLVRAYTLAMPPAADGRLTLAFDRVPGGLASAYLWAVEPGEAIEFTGPLGNFTLPEDGDLVLVARYTGIVPFRAMLLALAALAESAQGGARRVRLVYSAPSEAERIYGEELAGLVAAHPDWLEYWPIGEGEEATLIAAYGDLWLPFVPMVCGVRPFTAVTRAFFMERFGFERRAVRLENYS
jgi:ferredoxin-NADP reductase